MSVEVSTHITNFSDALEKKLKKIAITTIEKQEEYEKVKEIVGSLIPFKIIQTTAKTISACPRFGKDINETIRTHFSAHSLFTNMAAIILVDNLLDVSELGFHRICCDRRFMYAIEILWMKNFQISVSLHGEEIEKGIKIPEKIFHLMVLFLILDVMHRWIQLFDTMGMSYQRLFSGLVEFKYRIEQMVRVSNGDRRSEDEGVYEGNGWWSHRSLSRDSVSVRRESQSPMDIINLLSSHWRRLTEMTLNLPCYPMEGNDVNNSSETFIDVPDFSALPHITGKNASCEYLEGQPHETFIPEVEGTLLLWGQCFEKVLAHPEAVDEAVNETLILLSRNIEAYRSRIQNWISVLYELAEFPDLLGNALQLNQQLNDAMEKYNAFRRS